MKHQARTYCQDGFEIVELSNASVSAVIAVTVGNTLFSLSREKEEVLYFPFSLGDYQSNAKLAGNPFMHPWANRLEDEYIRTGSRQYRFPEAQTHLLYRDGNHLPLHGLLLKSDKWKTIALHEAKDLCFHIAEFVFDDAAFLSLFPFRHKVQIKHQLQDNALKIETTIINEEEKEMPVNFGFHPYFIRKEGSSHLTVPAENAIEVDDKLIPTGKSFPKESRWGFKADTIDLQDVAFDDGFQHLKRDESGQAVFLFNDIRIPFDRHYPFVQIYAPKGADKRYVCIEPMTAPTNALNAGGCPFVGKGEVFTAAFTIVRGVKQNIQLLVNSYFARKANKI